MEIRVEHQATQATIHLNTHTPPSGPSRSLPHLSSTTSDLGS